jgi:peptidoglycan/xylan/chitin deacetylase (PgdA/CDA1 family)
MKFSGVFACAMFMWGVTASARPASAAADTAVREVAVTVDDLPAGAASPTRGDAKSIIDMTTKIIATLKQQNVPAVGFVNEQKVYKWGEVDERIRALAMWLDAGFELGNHTFSHPSLNKVGLQEFEDNVIQGESVLKLLLAQHKMKLRYFRHPYLDTGRDLRTKMDADAFLTGRGYRIAPVTMDAWDWMFASVYSDAKTRGDAAMEQQTVSAYLSYTETVFAFYEKFSKELFGYEPKQILLLHGNQLEADHLGDVLDLLRKRGYRFITLENALSDQVYSLPDTYIGEEGTGWIDHWAISRGITRKDFPVAPAAFFEKYQALTPPPD